MSSLDRNIWMQQMEGKESLGKEECPFCLDIEYIIKEFQHWNIFKNKYPYAGIEDHLLLVTKRHIEHTKELQEEELLELPQIEAFFEEYFSGKNYFSFIRHTNAGKSICHIHYHYIPKELYSDGLESIL